MTSRVCDEFERTVERRFFMRNGVLVAIPAAYWLGHFLFWAWHGFQVVAK